MTTKEEFEKLVNNLYDKLSEEENEDNVDKKGFETNGDDGSEEELENLVN